MDFLHRSARGLQTVVFLPSQSADLWLPLAPAAQQGLPHGWKGRDHRHLSLTSKMFSDVTFGCLPSPSSPLVALSPGVTFWDPAFSGHRLQRSQSHPPFSGFTFEPCGCPASKLGLPSPPAPAHPARDWQSCAGRGFVCFVLLARHPVGAHSMVVYTEQ